MNINLYNHHLTLKYPIHTAHSIITERPTILIELITEQGVFWSEAPGFVSNAYQAETHQSLLTRWHESAATIRTVFDEGRQKEYLATIIDEPIFRYSIDVLYAQWLAASQQQTFFNYLGCMERRVDGAAMLGILPDKDQYDHRLSIIKDNGYQALKLKVTPESFDLIKDVIHDHHSDFDYICVDANASFSSDTMMRLSELPEIVTIEQPLPPEDHHFFLSLINKLPNQFLVDESVRSIDDIDLFKGLGVGIMLKPVCMGGIQPTLESIARCSQYLIPCGVSGYMDSGVGRYIQWCFTQYPSLLLRSDFVWSDYYFEDDVMQVLPPITSADQLQVSITEAPILSV